MTRFARAKGSKSSNEKVPEEATPWSELKKGLLNKSQPLSEETKTFVSAVKSKGQEEKPSEWVSLDDENDDSLTILKKHLEKRKKGKANLNSNDQPCVDEKKLQVKGRKREKTENEESQVQKKKKKREVSEDSSITKVENLNTRGKKKKKAKEVTADFENKNEDEKKNVEGITKKTKVKQKVSKTAKSVKTRQNGVKGKTGGKKRKSDQNFVNDPVNSGEETDKLQKKKMKSFVKINSNTAKISESSLDKFKNSKKDNTKSNPNQLTINIGGEMVDLVKFQGFYVTKDDSKRLKELRKKMSDEGIPENQIESAIKLERRRCEKALARMKKNVCFQCRKPGHVLSQCPQLQDSVDTSTGVCYKCGSTEHKAFTCRVSQGNKYPFAECFICKEKGHIARECPDNPRGLYPKGGCCKLCGDVTHLKKDCPKRISETEERTIKLGVRDDRNLEGLDDENSRSDAIKKKQKKRPVRF